MKLLCARIYWWFYCRAFPTDRLVVLEREIKWMFRRAEEAMREMDIPKMLEIRGRLGHALRELESMKPK